MKHDKLFELIGAMSSTEKAYFKKFGHKVAKSSRPEHLLFDRIVMGQKRGLEGNKLQAWVSEGYSNHTERADLPKMRSRLYGTLISALCSHNSAKYDLNAYFNIMAESHQLVAHNLMNNARMELQQGIQLARKHEKPHLELLLVKEQSSILIRQGDHASIIDSLNEQLHALKRMEQLTLLAKYYEEAFHLQRTVGLSRDRDAAMAQQLEDIRQKAEALDLNDCPPSAMFNYYMLNQVIAFILNRTAVALEFTERAFQLTVSSPEIISGKERIAVALLSNLIHDGLIHRDLTYYNRYFQKLSNWNTADRQLLNYRDALALKLTLMHTLLTAAFGQFALLTKHYERTDCTVLDSTTHNAMLGQLAHLAFIDEAYRPCIKVIYKVIEADESHRRQDLQSNMELLLIVTHIEMNNLDTAEQLIASLEYRDGNRKVLSKAEQVLVALFRKLPTAVDRTAQSQLYRAAYQKLAPEMNDRQLGFFNPLVWVQCKMEGIAYATALKAHYQLPLVDS